MSKLYGIVMFVTSDSKRKDVAELLQKVISISDKCHTSIDPAECAVTYITDCTMPDNIEEANIGVKSQIAATPRVRVLSTAILNRINDALIDDTLELQREVTNANKDRQAKLKAH